MLADARTIPDGRVIEADVCIVGGGPAGIALARQLLGGPWHVVVLESGGLAMQRDAQALNDGASAGAAYPVATSRVRAFGGTTHVWGGWSRPLDASDFDARDWIPSSGWPFDRAHLDPFYARAHALCGLGPYEYGAAAWNDEAPSAFPSGTGLDEIVFQIAAARFGTDHLPSLRAAANVDVLLHATALRLAMHPSGRAARGVRVATAAGNRFTVAARATVLAAGGLENPRLLLASGGGSAGGVGNAHDLVGRYFADHLHVPVGTLRTDAPAQSRRYLVHRVRGTLLRRGLALASPTRGAHRLLGSAVTLHNADDPHDVLSPGPTSGGYQSLMALARGPRRGWPEDVGRHVATALRHADEALLLAYRRLRPPPPRRLTVGVRAEQAPNRESRVRLDDTTDRFGVPRLRLEWKVAERDLESLAATQALLARALAGAPGTSRVTMRPAEGADGWRDRIAPGAHHIGTTRMHHEPPAGVVDAHCRVHGTDNVFVAGSSVFPTSGWAPPTLTIVALALRLADHLAAWLGREPGTAAGD